MADTKRVDRVDVWVKRITRRGQFVVKQGASGVEEFNLDPETNLIDCDVLSLPEMAQDLKEMTDGLKDVWGMSINDRLKYLGMEPIEDAVGNLRLVPTGLTNLEEFTVPQVDETDLQYDTIGED